MKKLSLPRILIIRKHFYPDLCFIALIVVLSSVVYGLTLCPTVYMGDSGDLCAAALAPGIAHAPGYPLFTILGYFFSLIIPGAGSAFDINLMCAVLGSVTLVVIYGLMRSAGCFALVACVTALTFGFINPVWSQAVAARVYTLNNALMAGALWCLFQYGKTGRWRMMQFYALLLGFGLANNPLSILTLPLALIYVCTVRTEKSISMRQRILILIWIIPGLLLYLYIPLCGLTEPAVHWGKPGIDRSFWLYLIRHDYMGRAYVQSVRDALEVVWHYLSLLPAEYTIGGCILILLGIYYTARRSWRMTVSLVMLYMLNIALMIMHSPHPDVFFWPRYISPAFLATTILFGFGLQYVVFKLISIRWLRLVVIVVPVWLIVVNYHDNDRSENYFAYDYAMFILNQLPVEAELVSGADDTVTFSLIYLHRVMGIRRDITLYTPGVIPGNMPSGINPAKKMFATRDTLFDIRDYDCVPFGLLFRVVNSGEDVAVFNDWDIWRIRNLQSSEVAFDYTARVLLGNYFFMRALNAARVDMDASLMYIDKAINAGYDVITVQHNSGSFLLRYGYTTDARRCFERVRSINRQASTPIF